MGPVGKLWRVEIKSMTSSGRKLSSKAGLVVLEPIIGTS